MAKSAIGVGTNANDGTGDDLRSGAIKINANFDEIYTELGDGTNLASASSTQTLTNKTLTAPSINGVVGGTQTSATITTLTTEGITNATGELEITAANQVVEIQGGGSNSGAITLNCEQNTHGQKIIAASHSVLQSGGPSTLTLPGTGAASQELVSTAATQTLTNKTLTAPTITGAGAIAGVFTGNITGNVTGNVTGTVDGVVGGTTPAAVTGTTITSTTTFQLKTYADTTARDAAISSPAAGMLVYLTATNKAQVYTGSAWETITSS